MNTTKKGFVVSTDPCRINFSGEVEWTVAMSPEKEGDPIEYVPFGRMLRGEYLYWIDPLRQMNGDVEKATVYAAQDEAEGGAFLAASLDPALAGHLHVMDVKEAYKRDHSLIEERARLAAQRVKCDANRFRLEKDAGL